MKRRPLIVGNWKLHNTVGEAIALVEGLKRALGDVAGCEVAVCPPFTALYAVRGALCGTAIALGAQDCHWAERGPFTGEVSPGMLRDVGCRFVIVGHSERRQHFGETDAVVNQKLLAALAAGLNPILCVGERARDREAGRTQEVVAAQLEGGLAGVSAARLPEVVVAYEPVWAIGTGTPARPEDAAAVAVGMRQCLRAGWGESSEAVRLLYGGSVSGANVRGFLGQAVIDGALVGGLSLDPVEFARIVEAARSLET